VKDLQWWTSLRRGLLPDPSALKARGFKIWHAESVLEPGDKLLESVEQGLRDSSYGILLISPDYLRKGWTQYEMDILIRQHIEQSKKLFPIWHQLEKAQVEARSPGLAGIFALRSDSGFQALVNRLSKSLSPAVSTQALIPGWESAGYRFTQGIGELILASDGAAFNLWEALLHFEPDRFPLAVNGEVFTLEALLAEVAQIIAIDPLRIEDSVGKDGLRSSGQCALDMVLIRMFSRERLAHSGRRLSATASSRTPRRISLASTAAKPSCNPSRARGPRL